MVITRNKVVTFINVAETKMIEFDNTVIISGKKMFPLLKQQLIFRNEDYMNLIFQIID